MSPATAGFVAVLVGFTSAVAIVFQAATALGATPSQLSAWMWALGLDMDLCTPLPSLWLWLWLRQPGRHRFGVLGRGRRRGRAFCATVAAPRQCLKPSPKSPP